SHRPCPLSLHDALPISATLPLAAAPMPARLAVTVGGDAVARVRVRRGDAPQAGVPLILRGSSSIPGGPPQDAQAVTDASGTAVRSEEHTSELQSRFDLV